MIVPALALALCGLLVTTVGPLADTTVNDLFVYRTYAGFVLDDGLLPYADFGFEYPPLALVPMLLAGLGGAGDDPQRYALAFGGLMLAAALAAQRLSTLLVPRAQRALVAWAWVPLPLLAGASARTHFDLLVVVAVLGGLALVVRGRAAGGLAVLGAGAAVKLVPALVGLVAVAWIAGWGPRTAVRAALAGAAVALALCAPFAVLAPSGFAEQFAFHLERPVQIESAPATVLWALGGSYVTGHPVRPDPYKSNGLAGGAAPVVAALFAALALAAVAAVTWLAARAPADPRALIRAAAAVLLAFVALGKVLSPQFLLWLLPFVPLLALGGDRAAAAAIAAAAVLTLVEFPGAYFDLVAGEDWVVAVVAARNAVLLAAGALLLVRLWGDQRVPGAGRSTGSMASARPGAPARITTPMSHGSSSAGS